MTTTAVELESLHETEIPCQKLISNRINKGVGGDTTLTSSDLKRRRQRIVCVSYEKSDVECNCVVSQEALF